jgi:hypothetical protein
MYKNRADLKKILLFALLGGCGGVTSPPPPTPAIPNASITGQYNLVLTSTNGHGTTNIYTNFTQTGATFTGAASTLVCLSNDLSKCEGNNALAVSITPSGTVSGANVRMTISFPSTAGADTVTLVGTAAGTDLAGTYTDSVNDAGTWSAFSVSALSGTYSGTFNSTSNPLAIAPTILITLAQDTSFHLTGTATIMNSPCISFLTLSGQAIGEAFSLTDPANEAVLTAVPSGNGFNFSYNFDPTAAHCAGDFGLGVVTNQSPWDY